MREAVVVSTARTPIGRAFRGGLNNIKSPSLMAHAISHAVERAGAEGGEVEDVVVGAVLTAGTAGMNLARNASIAAGLPVDVSAQTMDRQCASGLMAIATAAKQVIVDGMNVVVAGGCENISAVQTAYMDWAAKEKDLAVIARAEHAYMPMLQTAEFASRKYSISRKRRMSTLSSLNDAPPRRSEQGFSTTRSCRSEQPRRLWTKRPSKFPTRPLPWTLTG